MNTVRLGPQILEPPYTISILLATSLPQAEADWLRQSRISAGYRGAPIRKMGGRRVLLHDLAAGVFIGQSSWYGGTRWRYLWRKRYRICSLPPTARREERFARGGKNRTFTAC